MDSTLLVLSLAAFLVAVSVITARLFWDVRTLKRQKEDAEASANGHQRLGESRHFEYNALISDVSELLEEKVQQVKLVHELTVAKAVQETLLPEQAHHVYGPFSVYGKVRLQNACGGDWWYHSRKDDQVTLWIGDVTGHGVPSALIASACRAAIGSFSEMGIADAETAMTALNKILYPMMKTNMFISAICLSVDCKTGMAKVVNASHPSAIFIGHDRTAKELQEIGNPLLGFQPTHDYKGITVKLEEQDVLILLTDGVLDFPHPARPMWSPRRLGNFLSQAAKEELHLISIMHKLEDKLQTKAPQEDDITYVAIQRNRVA